MKDGVSYIFGDMIERLEATDKEVGVEFVSGSPTAACDLVVAADGIGSKIRGIAFGNCHSHVRSLDSYVSCFSIPFDNTDSMWSRAHWVRGLRYLVLRPNNIGRNRAFLGLTAYEKSDERLVRLETASKEDIPVQGALIQELFQDPE